ncbi:Ribosomal large subunit pseudouridine synthase E LSU [Candidatus Paraburkholderia calva]|nr:Ribosomal large subunit pseudouridine synthase E LSU [Candidatus Paraburkholderia calva]
MKTPGVYLAGRLDADSEGLLLTDDGALQARIAEPRHKLVKRYWAQVEGAPGDDVLVRLAKGVDLGDYVTRPCRSAFVSQEDSERLWTRTAPIRYRAAIPTTWIELAISEGKNQQVRRMTAAAIDLAARADRGWRARSVLARSRAGRMRRSLHARAVASRRQNAWQSTSLNHIRRSSD